MEKLVKTYYVPGIDTLDIWLGEPDEEVGGEEVADGIIAKLDRHGQIIGVEIVSLSKTRKEELVNLPEEIRQALLQSMRELAAAASQLS